MISINTKKKDVWKTHIRKILFVMRLTTVIILLTLFQLKADSSFAQRISYVKNNISLIQLFKEIKKQTGHNIIWNEEKIDLSKSVNANFNNNTLEEVLNTSLNGMPLSYSITRKTINIKLKKPSFLVELLDNFTAIDVRGTVLDDQGMPLNGASVRVKGTNKSAITNEKGQFYLQDVMDNAVLVITYLGFVSQEIKASANIGSIRLALSDDKLEEVEIVSTGYQDLPKERATGSFTIIDNKLLNRSVSPDILSRLKGITNGLLIDRPGGGNTTGISVRGRSTIFSETQPLIIVDNFPFVGDINSINPDDVENVTILKDAAAASIWGTQAGNGVIVITMKKGKLNSKPTIAMSSNLTIGEKPDLYYQEKLTSSEFIEVEKFLFDKGAYNAAIATGYQAISPVVELLNKAKLDPSFTPEANRQIDAYRNLDFRKQVNQYLLRNSSLQQYNLNVSGGGENQSYFFSGGYFKNLSGEVGDANSRITLKGSNVYHLLNKKLKLSTDITLTSSKLERLRGYQYSTHRYPYVMIADENGNPLAIQSPNPDGLRGSYTDTAGNGRLLDWKYRPLQEMREKNSRTDNNVTNYLILLGASYKVLKQLTASVNYQYFSSNGKTETLDNRNSFYTRNEINYLSQINGITGEVIRPIPLGDIYGASFTNGKSHYGRAQLDYSQTFADKHLVTALTGYEIRDDQASRNHYDLFGYFPEIGTSATLNLTDDFTNYVTGREERIRNSPTQGGTIGRNISLYGNASYIYDEKYIISGSYRKDESNLFGVKANQKGVPLWSTGLSWNLHKESFFNVTWLSRIQLRATYGYNGNVNRDVSAYLTASPSNSFNKYDIRYYEIVNPPNDALRWERVKNINFGADFATKNDRISGSLEYYIKNGIDLIGASPIAPQSGILIFTGNSADTRTKGTDLQLNTRNIVGKFQWSTTAIFNFVKDKVTAYKANVGNNATLMSSSLSPIVGYPIRSLFAYKWNGLDATGAPLGELNGIVSKDYVNIRTITDHHQLDFLGSAVPNIFGGLRNTLGYKGLEFSFNISYKFNYYFRRASLAGGILNGNGSYQHPDFSKRWQQPGDEFSTHVPSLVYPGIGNRSDFYTYSSVLVEKGDHIRLQDIRLSYHLDKSSVRKLPFTNISVYCYANNLGILWRSNNLGLDPDLGGSYSGYPAPRTYAFGLNANF